MKMKRDGLKSMGSMPKYGLRTSIEKRPIAPYRIRRISGSFAFIEHRFLRDGFWASLDPHWFVQSAHGYGTPGTGNFTMRTS